MDHRWPAMSFHAFGALIVCVLFSPTVWVQQPEGCDGTPVEYSVSIQVGEGDTKESLRQRAKEQAEREIIERYCGSVITSTTQVADSQVVADSILQASRGVITDLEALDGGHYESREDKDQPGRPVDFYKLTVRATAARMAGTDDPNFKLQAVMNKAEYSDGETGQLTVTLGEPAYLYIFNVGSDSSISILFPNRIFKDNYVAPGVFHYPSPEQQGQGVNLRFAAAEGQVSQHLREYMEILATKIPLDLSQSKIREAINRPLSIRDTAPNTELAKLLLKLHRDQVTATTVAYEIYRPPQPTP